MSIDTCPEARNCGGTSGSPSWRMGGDWIPMKFMPSQMITNSTRWMPQNWKAMAYPSLPKQIIAGWKLWCHGDGQPQGYNHQMPKKRSHWRNWRRKKFIEERHTHAHMGKTQTFTILNVSNTKKQKASHTWLVTAPCRSLERICIQESINANIHLNQEEHQTVCRRSESLISSWSINASPEALIWICWFRRFQLCMFTFQENAIQSYYRVDVCITTRSMQNFAQSLVHNCSTKFTPMTQEHQRRKKMICNNLSELVKPSPSLN